MARNDEILKKLRAGNFVENNGTVIRAINLLRTEYIELKSVWRVCSEKMSEQEFLDCVHFLSREGYIELQRIGTAEIVKLANHNYRELEAIVIPKGVRLLGGQIQDEMVDV